MEKNAEKAAISRNIGKNETLPAFRFFLNGIKQTFLWHFSGYFIRIVVKSLTLVPVGPVKIRSPEILRAL